MTFNDNSGVVNTTSILYPSSTNRESSCTSQPESRCLTFKPCSWHLRKAPCSPTSMATSSCVQTASTRHTAPTSTCCSDATSGPAVSSLLTVTETPRRSVDVACFLLVRLGRKLLTFLDNSGVVYSAPALYSLDTKQERT